MGISDKYKEWFYQSDYDYETAIDMFKSGRNIYCIFMCHLCLEKALKGLYLKRTGEFPIKSHSLVYFVDKMELKLSESYYEFLFMLNKISVPTRYPDDLRKLTLTYTMERTENILSQSKEVQEWIKKQ